MDDGSACKGGAESLFVHEEEEVDLEKSLADDFGSYDCFMQPFDTPDEGDDEELEMECLNEEDENNSNHQVTDRLTVSFLNLLVLEANYLNSII